MSDDPRNDKNESAASWIRETLNRAVQEITSHGIFDGDFVEARPLWSLPGKVMIGQIRDTNGQTTFRWFICGDLPTDHVPANVASTPRDAMRHFSLKWQLGVARYEDPATRQAAGMQESPGPDERGTILAARAEELYEMVADDNLWQEAGGS